MLFVVLLCELGTQVPPPQGGLLAVPCGQGIPPSQTPHIDTSGMYFTLELYVLYNIVVILPFFLSFPFLSNATGSSLAAVPTVTRERERFW